MRRTATAVATLVLCLGGLSACGDDEPAEACLLYTSDAADE